jgi:hypothetical protein
VKSVVGLLDRRKHGGGIKGLDDKSNGMEILMTLSEEYVVYYESIKRELQIRCIYECRCDETLQTKTKEFTRLAHTGLVVEQKCAEDLS